MNRSIFSLAKLHKKGVIPKKKAVSDGTCTGCVNGSSGDCINSFDVCYTKSGDVCPAGTTDCSSGTPKCTSMATAKLHELSKCYFITTGEFGERQNGDGSDPSCKPDADLTAVVDNCKKYNKDPYKKKLIKGEFKCTESGTNAMGCGIDPSPCPECQKQPCFIHGPINTGGCTIGHYDNNDQSEYERRWELIEPNIGKLVNLTINDKKYTAIISAGHGVLDGKCGSLALIKYNNKYAVNFQIGPRAWSLEIHPDALKYLDADEAANCQVPEVMKLEWSDIVTDGSKGKNLNFVTS